MDSIPENPQLLKYARDSLEIIQMNCQAYEAGSSCCYRVLAVQLRILLCDRKREHNTWRDISLATRLVPHLSFHPLNASFPLNLDENPTLPTQWIDPDRPTLPIAAWLDQGLFSIHGKLFPIRGLIKWISEKDGGAHVDPAGFVPSTYRNSYLEELTYQLAIYTNTELSHALEG